MDNGLVILCTAPDEPTALRLARGLVEARLAACVNITQPIRSVYLWKGEVFDEVELQLVIKTTRERFESLETWLSKAHPYDVPEIIALPITKGSAAYLSWVRQSVEEGLSSDEGSR
ncbi:MAG: divalent-cation tolerance protein CutA [Myxococcota bacterium]